MDLDVCDVLKWSKAELKYIELICIGLEWIKTVIKPEIGKIGMFYKFWFWSPNCEFDVLMMEKGGLDARIVLEWIGID